ncbi:MAG: hypothetical protein RLZZ592_1864 [Pseudomonadota bacterium]|jgi:copper(I)-binding protein
MKFSSCRARLGRGLRLVGVLMAGAVGMAPAGAHDFRVGDLFIDHPYATPTLPGARAGVLYLRALRNQGTQPDRLLGARTAVATSVEIHHRHVNGQGVMHMRAVEAIDLPAGTEMKQIRHAGDYHLMLVGLTQPLETGSRFPVTLRFERAGEREVMVEVQPSRAAAAHDHRH